MAMNPFLAPFLTPGAPPFQPAQPPNPAMRRLGAGAFLAPFLTGFGAALAADNPAAGIQPMQQMQALSAQRRGANATAQYLRAKGRDDLASLVEAGGIDGAQALKMAQGRMDGVSFGKSPVYGTDPKTGKTVLGTVGDDGSFKVLDTPGFEASSGVDKVDLGTHYGIINKRTGDVVGTMPKENYQEAFEKAEGGKAGERAGELPVLKSKAVSTMEALGRQRALVRDEIGLAKQLIQSSPNMATGLVGGLSKAVPGTAAFQLAKRLESIKANIGFDKLQEMRQNSPTGGALGQVSDFENRQLQAVFGSLEQANTAEDIAYNLRRLEEIIANSDASVREAFERDFGGAPQTIPPPQFNRGKRVQDMSDEELEAIINGQ